MAIAAPIQTSEPFVELNITPLIDVMLVLLVMFIMSIPVAVHDLPFDLPPATPIVDLPKILPENTLTIGPKGQVAWNGTALSEGALAAVLADTVKHVPEPLVRFTPDGSAPYGASARILRLIKYSGVTAFAFVGTEQFGTFSKAAPPH